LGTSDLFAAMEGRHAHQQQFLDRGAVLVQVSLNLPGGFALYPWRGLIVEAGSALTTQLASQGLAIIAEEHVVDVLGPCSLFAVLGDGQIIKRQCIRLEEEALRGRLWDIDVLTQAGPIDRGSLGIKGRVCWVCGVEEAHVCRRLGRHIPEEVVSVAQSIARGVRNT